MTIWILALLLIGGLAGVGYAQGAIRVGISFVGIIVAALLAGPLAKLVKPAVIALGAANPVLQWVLPPFVVFLIVLVLFKVGAMFVHRKVDYYYRYKAGDLRLALWERLNARLGLCLGTLNGLAYLVLICMVIYPLGYWTVQMSSPDEDPALIRFFNRMSRDLQSTGMLRVARAIDPMPDVFYDAADLTGLIYQNFLLEARLSRYPAFLSLAEGPEFQALAKDESFAKARAAKAPIREILDNPNVKNIVSNPEMLKRIWGIVTPDLKDLIKFLKEGSSEKYADKILGRWFFDARSSVAAYIRTKQNIPSREMQTVRTWIAGTYDKTMIVASPDHQVVIKNYPQIKVLPGQPPTTEMVTLKGQWKGEDNDYEFSLEGGTERKAKIEAGRLALAEERLTLVFTPEDYQ